MTENSLTIPRTTWGLHILERISLDLPYTWRLLGVDLTLKKDGSVVVSDKYALPEIYSQVQSQVETATSNLLMLTYLKKQLHTQETTGNNSETP